MNLILPSEKPQKFLPFFLSLSLFILLSACLGSRAFSQSLRNYESKLISPQNRPVAGATIRNVNRVLSTRSGADGSFSIQAATGDSLQISAAGFTSLYYIIPASPEPAVVLAQEGAEVELIQPVRRPYQSIPAQLSVSSSDAVYSADILKSPVVSFRNALAGRLTGLYALQPFGLPGNDGALLSLRGQTPNIIVDGVVANLTTFDLEEIESITVQKDALGTATLGVRGSPGAIIVTTKKGKEGKQQISFTAQTAVQQALGFPKTLNAYDYARLRNESLRNEGIDSANSGLYYSSTALEAYRTHSDPYNYPDVNFLDAVTNKTSMLNRYTLSTTGGNRFARYFVSLEHLNQSGILKTADSNAYNTNNNFKSYVIRSNVDVSITSKLTGGIYLLGRILNGNEPGATTNSIFNSILTTPANAYPILNANGSFGGNQVFQNNVLAQTISSGYRQNYKRDILVNLYLKRTLDEVTPGLWIQARASYYSTLSETVYRDKSYAVFQQGTGGAYTQFGTNGTQVNNNGLDYQGRSDYEEFSIGYDRTFNKVHGINALVIANRDNSPSGSFSELLPYTIVGTSGRVSYNYGGRYIAEVAWGLNGSNRYPGGNHTKLGLFPSFGLGWNLEQESFLKSQTWLSRLKLFGSIGKTGYDNPGYFVYYPRFFDGPTAYFGTGASGVTTITEGTLPNGSITWEKATKLNLGLNGAVLGNHLRFSIEHFRNKYYDLVMQRGTSSTTIGNDYPNENIGRNRYTGWEGELGWQQTKGKFQYFVSANGSTLGSKVLYISEVARPYSYNLRTGQPVGVLFGYQATGLFRSQADINGAATTLGYKAQPGDVRFKDLNGDGVIDYKDQTTITTTKPLLYYGLSAGFSFKGFDISALLQGVKNRDIYVGSDLYLSYQSYGIGQAYSTALNRWTPATAATATYPRLSYGTNTNNYALSSYWVKSGDYFRLKNAEIGYSLPASLIGKIKLQTVRIFANGYNLLTHTSDNLDGRDPEANFGGYPIQRLYNFGVNVKF
ncbi:MAG: SusC/RagA family TonB-linked outer membrane protein [Williamsia sp.]|nr:SusC/RagA family TonB-linked outer membrane protein [Williamsia sp.]